jgi:hypothetical protein
MIINSEVNFLRHHMKTSSPKISKPKRSRNFRAIEAA